MIRPATDTERAEFLQGDRGFIAIESGKKVGQVAYHTRHDGLFYAHSLESQGSEIIAARLFQAVRKLARNMGYPKVDFCISAEAPSLLKLVQKKKIRMKQMWMEIDS